MLALIDPAMIVGLMPISVQQQYPNEGKHRLNTGNRLCDINQLMNQSNFYSTNIPSEARLSNVTAKSMFNSKIEYNENESNYVQRHWEICWSLSTLVSTFTDLTVHGVAALLHTYQLRGNIDKRGGTTLNETKCNRWISSHLQEDTSKDMYSCSVIMIQWNLA